MLVLDKLGFGLIGALILVLATGGINFGLETFRSDNSIHQEVAKARFNKTAEIWERLNEYEGAVRKASREARGQATAPEWVARGMPIEVKRQQLAEVSELIDAAAQSHERFWNTYYANRSYVDRAAIDRIWEHYRYVRMIDLAEDDEVRHANLRAEVESWLHQPLPKGRDYTTPAIQAAEERLETTRQTAMDIEKSLVNQSQN